MISVWFNGFDVVAVVVVVPFLQNPKSVFKIREAQNEAQNMLGKAKAKAFHHTNRVPFFTGHSFRFSASLKSSTATETLWIIMLMLTVTSTLLRCSYFKWFNESWALRLMAKCWKSFNFTVVCVCARATGVGRIDGTTFLLCTIERNCGGWMWCSVLKMVVKFIDGKIMIVEWLRWVSVRLWTMLSYFCTDVGWMLLNDEPFNSNSPEVIVITGSSVVVVFNAGVMIPRWIDCCLKTSINWNRLTASSDQIPSKLVSSFYLVKALRYNSAKRRLKFGNSSSVNAPPTLVINQNRLSNAKLLSSISPSPWQSIELQSSPSSSFWNKKFSNDFWTGGEGW